MFKKTHLDKTILRNKMYALKKEKNAVRRLHDNLLGNKSKIEKI